MAIKTRDELMQTANGLFGENSDDNVLEFIGDLSDTLASVADSAQRISQLEEENRQIDNNWRKKYRERFFAPVGDDDRDDDPNPPALKTKYEELFK